MAPEPIITLKWRGLEHSFEIPLRGSLHEAVVSRFDIPRDRLKLILRGKTFGPEESAELISESILSKTPIMVIGSPSVEQLDSTHNRAREARTWAWATTRCTFVSFMSSWCPF